MLASPLSHMTRQQVLPYLMKMDLEVGEEVVEETLVGYRTSHKESLFQALSQEPLLGISAGPYTSLEEDLLSERGPSND